MLTVWNVDASWDATSSKCEDVQRGEVWTKEVVLLKVCSPGEVAQEVLRLLDQTAKLAAHLLVHHGNEA